MQAGLLGFFSKRSGGQQARLSITCCCDLLQFRSEASSTANGLLFAALDFVDIIEVHQSYAPCNDPNVQQRVARSEKECECACG
jgi:hypothetical protein